MSNGPDLDHLAAQWAEHPEGLLFAPLADGLRKRGAASDALDIVTTGLARHPLHVPGLVVAARLHLDAGRHAEADSALREALRADPSHPVVLEWLAEAAEASGNVAAARAWREALGASLPDADVLDDAGEGAEFDEIADDDGAELLSESLAALYERQGHTERAYQLYVALAAREPGNTALATRRDALAAEITGRRPLPYDARASGGTSLGDWLAAVATARADVATPRAGYDAFFEAEAPAPDDSADIEAFQSWLKGLPR